MNFNDLTSYASNHPTINAHSGVVVVSGAVSEVYSLVVGSPFGNAGDISLVPSTTDNSILNPTAIGFGGSGPNRSFIFFLDTPNLCKPGKTILQIKAQTSASSYIYSSSCFMPVEVLPPP